MASRRSSRAVGDRHVHCGPVAEARLSPVRQLDDEGAALDASQHALERASGQAVDERQARGRLAADRGGGHVRTVPRPGSNGGLWWNGTRLAKSFAACQWIFAVTCRGCSG